MSNIDNKNTDHQTSLGLQPRLEERDVYNQAHTVSKANDFSHEESMSSALQELSAKVDLCLQKQRHVRFITKEISEIIKKST